MVDRGDARAILHQLQLRYVIIADKEVKPYRSLGGNQPLIKGNEATERSGVGNI